METQKQYDDDMIKGLFKNFIEAGGDPKVTDFKQHLNDLIDVFVKPLCGRKSKSSRPLPDVVNWRREVKDRFSGRGAKWVKVSLEEIAPTLEGFDDVTDYMGWIQSAGFAWIRFAGPRVANGSHCAAFEVRTGGSTIDHPKQLHYIPVQLLDEKIEALNSTPHAMRLEETSQGVYPPLVEDKAQVAEEVEVTPLSGYEMNPYDDGGSAYAEDDDCEDAMGDIDELMEMEDEDI